MPISIVVGGQYGSEGKGKVALEMVRRDRATKMVVRPGGTNSGHTGYSLDGRRIVLRQLPAAAIDGMVTVVFPPGSYIDPPLLLKEIHSLNLPDSQVIIDPRAHVIRNEHVQWESQARLSDSIGSTGSGTGAAVLSRIARYAEPHPLGIPASAIDELQPYLADTSAALGTALAAGERILIEGTQGFGLSVLHGDVWPKATSRDTTAAGLLSEAGLSPLDVDTITLVLRCYPIRVAGDSGPLPNETSWQAIAHSAGITEDLRELTSVTQKLRRVGHFDPLVVRKALAANRPTDVVLNHVDYLDGGLKGRSELSHRAQEFVESVERQIDRSVDWIGTDEKSLFPAHSSRSAFGGKRPDRSTPLGVAG